MKGRRQICFQLRINHGKDKSQPIRIDRLETYFVQDKEEKSTFQQLLQILFLG